MTFVILYFSRSSHRHGLGHEYHGTRMRFLNIVFVQSVIDIQEFDVAFSGRMHAISCLQMCVFWK